MVQVDRRNSCGCININTYIVTADRVAIDINKTSFPKQNPGRGPLRSRRRRIQVGMSADGVASDCSCRAASYLNAILGNVGDRTIASDRVTYDICMRSSIIDDNTGLLVTADLVIDDVGRAGGCPKLPSHLDSIAILAAALACIPDIDNFVVVNVGMCAITNQDAKSDSAATTRPGAADSEVAYLSGNPSSSDFHDVRISDVFG